MSSPDKDNANFEMLNVAISLGYDAADIFAAVQEVTIIAQAAIPPQTVTDSTATERFLHLATVGMLFEKGMLTERKQ